MTDTQEGKVPKKKADEVVTKAQEAVKKAEKVVTRVSDAVTEVKKAVKKADEVVTKGEDDVTKAQEAVKNAITAKDALKKAKDALNNSDNIMKAKDAKNAVEEFENAVEKVENAVKEAENAVKEARNTLNEAKVLKKKVQEVVTKAENAVKEARNTLNEAVEKATYVVDKIKDDEKAVEEVEEAKKALKKVQEAVTAKEDVKEAEKAVEEAKKAKKTLKEVENAVKEGKEVKEAVTKIEDAVTKIEDAVARAVKEAEKAVKKAEDGVKEAVKKAEDGVKEAVKKAEDGVKEAVKEAENAVKEAENAVKEASAQVVIYIAYEYLTNNKYKNKKYVDPDKLVDKPSEKEYMEEFINYGRRAKTGITDFYENILNSIFTEEAKKFRSLEDKTELCFEKVYFSGLWKGGDMKRVHEFYVLFKDKAFEHINTSIALFISSKCESNSPVFLAIEMKDNGSKSLDYPRHNRLLHYNGESTENLYCTVTLNHSSSKHINPGLSKDTIKYVYDNNDKINNDHIKKVRLQYDINVDAPNIMEEIKKGIKELIPYYYYVVKMADKYKYQYQYNKNIILYGPPGTGKTYHTVYYAVGIIENKPYEIILSEDYEGVLRRYNNYKNERKIMFSTFHQSYSYEEFIGGIMPKLKDSSNEQSSDGKKDDNLLYELEPGKLKDSSKEQSSDEKKDNNLLYKLEPGKLKDSSKEQSSDERKDDNLLYELEPGKFKRFCDEAKDKKGNYVFIIDEINRGNISKIFGELITLIEESKRLGEKEEMKLQIPHFKDEFGVPNNVYIIGTMNTADRSIALIDTALRRRFNFVEMMPNPKIFEKKYISEEELNLDICKMLETINRRISVLYDREHTIGHAYFTSLIENPRTEQLAKIFRNSIIPLLQEYFYEDYEKIQLVLGDNKKSNADYKFIKDEKVIEKDIFKGQTDIDIAEKEYEINQKAFSNLQSYIEIYLDVSKPDVSKLDASKSEE